MPRTIYYLAALNNISQLRPALIILGIISAVLVISSIALYFPARRKQKHTGLLMGFLYTVTAITIICTMVCFGRYGKISANLSSTKNPALMQGNTQNDTTPSSATDSTDESSISTEPSEETTVPTTEETEPVTEPTTPPVIEDPKLNFTPGAIDSTKSENWGISWEVIKGGSIVDSFNRQQGIHFGDGSEYTTLEGITTFRGDNYRSGATYGTAKVENETISALWNFNIGTLNGWPGSGWTGQPLAVRWDEETKAVMNIYNEKKAKPDLVEVIHATLDGYIYFYDLEDGSYTRDPLKVGMNFKGAGAIDPRGYPLMYVGSGDYFDGKSPRFYIISLIDGKVLYEKSGADSFTLRYDWAAFDSAPLVDAETDTLIWPGESGILYTIKLNTKYDPAAGTIEINPVEDGKCRYNTTRSNGSTYWLGYEPSAVIVDRYLYTSENGGMFFCIDLDTLELVWAQDTKDDSNSTPVFQWDKSGETGYLYTAPSLHWTADSDGKGEMSIYKLDAKTGEIKWEYKYNCHTVSGVSGGVQSTPLLGKEGTDLEGLIIYTIARTPGVYSGVIIALDTETGNVVWEKPMDNYTWSSPVAVYTETEKSYIILCDSVGNVSLVEGSTGNILDTVNIGSNVEASPIVYGNIVVVGTRGQKIYGLKVE